MGQVITITYFFEIMFRYDTTHDTTWLNKISSVVLSLSPDPYTCQAIIRGKISIDSIIYSDKWRGYDGLVDVGYDKHFRVNHGNNEFAKGKNHINGIESFWSYALVLALSVRK